MDALRGSLTPHATMRGVLGGREQLRGGLGIGGGTTDYEELENKPAINGVELIGDQSAHDLGLALLTDIPESVDYSTNEVNTGVKWIDGKYIYQKTIDTGSSQIYNAGWHSIEPHGNYYDTLISASVTGGNFQMCAGVACNDVTYLEIYVPVNSYFRYITIQYTKVS